MGELTRASPCTPLQTQQGEAYFTTPAGGKVFSLPDNSLVRDCHNSINEKPLHFVLQVYSNGLYVYNRPFKLPPFRCKRALLLFGFVIAHMSQVAILYCSLLNPFLLVK